MGLPWTSQSTVKAVRASRLRLTTPKSSSAPWLQATTKICIPVFQHKPWFRVLTYATREAMTSAFVGTLRPSHNNVVPPILSEAHRCAPRFLALISCFLSHSAAFWMRNGGAPQPCALLTTMPVQHTAQPNERALLPCSISGVRPVSCRHTTLLKLVILALRQVTQVGRRGRGI